MVTYLINTLLVEQMAALRQPPANLRSLELANAHWTALIRFNVDAIAAFSSDSNQFGGSRCVDNRDRIDAASRLDVILCSHRSFCRAEECRQ